MKIMEHRDSEIMSLLDAGFTRGFVARRFGISAGRVGQIYQRERRKRKNELKRVWGGFESDIEFLYKVIYSADSISRIPVGEPVKREKPAPVSPLFLRLRNSLISYREVLAFGVVACAVPAPEGAASAAEPRLTCNTDT